MDLLAARERLPRDLELLHLRESRGLLVVVELSVGREGVDGESGVGPASGKGQPTDLGKEERKESNELGDYRLDDARHRQRLILPPPLRELLHLLLQVDVSDVSSLDDEVVRRGEDGKGVALAEDISGCESFRGADDNLEEVLGAVEGLGSAGKCKIRKGR